MKIDWIKDGEGFTLNYQTQCILDEFLFGQVARGRKRGTWDWQVTDLSYGLDHATGSETSLENAQARVSQIFHDSIPLVRECLRRKIEWMQQLEKELL